MRMHTTVTLAAGVAGGGLGWPAGARWRGPPGWRGGRLRRSPPW